MFIINLSPSRIVTPIQNACIKINIKTQSFIHINNLQITFYSHVNKKNDF